MANKKKKWITDNVIRSSKGTSYIQYSTNAHPNGAGKKRIIHRKKMPKR